MTLLVHRPGLLTTVQDAGRHGWQHLGVAPCGAMDAEAFALANRLVRNDPGAATLEITIRGPDLVFDRTTLVALAGATFEASIGEADGQRVPFPMRRPVLVGAGMRLRIGDALHGARGYLAVAGGIDVPVVLGSRSTYLGAHFGGLHGAPLRAQDALPLVAEVESLSRARFGALRRRLAPAMPGVQSVSWSVPVDSLPVEQADSIRFTEGRHWERFTPRAQHDMETTVYTVAPASNRMGYRLDGPLLERHDATQMISEPTCLGTIQVPAGGSPIILMADHQTTGGYAKIGEVASADIARLAQCAPGARLRFQRCSLDAALAMRAARVRRMATLAQSIEWEYG